MAQKKKRFYVWFIFAAVLMSFLIFAIAANLGVIEYAVAPSYEKTMVVPIWGRIECTQLEFRPRQAADVHVPEAGMSVWCDGKFDPQNIFTAGDCNVYLDAVSPVWWSGDVDVFYKKCKADGTGCDPQFTKRNVQEGSTGFIVKISPDEKLWVEVKRGGWLQIDTEADMFKEYYPWGLSWHWEGAKENIAGTCCMEGSREESKLKSLIRKEDYTNCLQPDEWRNFVTKWVYAPVQLVKSKKYGEVYCDANKLWEIETMTMADDAERFLNPEIIKPKRILEYVGCCPGTCLEGYFCNDDFKCESGRKQCTASIDCTNAGAPYRKATRLIGFEVCEGGECVEKEKIVECSSYIDCPAGEPYCVLWECKAGEPDFCGDGYCSSKETEESCPQDCGEEGSISCKAECDISYPKEGLLDLNAIGREVCNTKCDFLSILKKYLPWLAGFIGVVVALLLIALFLRLKER